MGVTALAAYFVKRMAMMPLSPRFQVAGCHAGMPAGASMMYFPMSVAWCLQGWLHPETLNTPYATV